MKNVLFEQKKITLWNTRHFVENKTEIIQYVLNKHYISRCFLRALTCASVGCLKVITSKRTEQTVYSFAKKLEESDQNLRNEGKQDLGKQR
jgi:hypothetical protein